MTLASPAYRRALPAILSVLVLGGAAWIWRDRIDLEAISGRLANTDPLDAGFAFVFLLAFSPVNAFRLKTISAWFAGAAPSFAALLRITCIGYFVSATAPVGLLGDAAKVGLMRPLVGFTWRSSLQSVLSDRISGAVFVAVLGALSLPLRFALGTPDSALRIDAIVFPLVLAATGLLIAVQRYLAKTDAKFWEVMRWLLAAASSLFSNVGRVVAQLVFACTNVLLWSGIIFLLAHGMGISVGALQIAQYVPIIILVTSLPLLYLGWGGREMIMVSTVGTLPGVSTNDALSLAISIGALGILAAIPNGLFLLAGWRQTPPKLTVVEDS